MNSPHPRRTFLTASAVASAFALGRCGECEDRAGATATGRLETFAPTRAITRGPKFHWFGYYDKREFDPTGRRVLANEVDFEGRAPTAEDQIAVGYVDTADRDRWVQIGDSRSWGWQQGCMLQWIGGRGEEILWNDRQGSRFVARVHHLATKSNRMIDRPIYNVSRDGTTGLSLNFSRLDNLRPGYGYEGLTDANVNERAPSDDGIWRVDLASGQSKLVLSVADAAALPWPDGKSRLEGWHYFNHLLLNPSGTRFIVLHRHRPKFDPATLQFEGNFVTRMLTVNVDGSDPFVLDPSGRTSHFIWKDDDSVTMYTQPKGHRSGFYEAVDRVGEMVRVGATKMLANGHNTYLPAPHNEWILNDTYPDAKTSRQTVYLYHPPTDRRVDLGHFPSPLAYRGEWRCDTHPRTSDDGRTVAVDSPHGGGRQVHLIEIGELLDRLG